MHLHISEQVFILFYICNLPLFDSQIVHTYQIGHDAEVFALFWYFYDLHTCACMCMSIHVPGVHVARGPLVRDCYPSITWALRWDSGPQAWHQAPTTLSHLTASSHFLLCLGNAQVTYMANSLSSHTQEG